MTDRYTVSTPPSSSRSAASSSANSRHLKRLSLSGSAFSPVSSPVDVTSSPAASANGSAAGSPLSSRTARPASVVGSPASYHPRAKAGDALADRTNSPSLLRRSTSYSSASTFSPANVAAFAPPSSSATAAGTTMTTTTTASAGALLASSTPERPLANTTERAQPTLTWSGSSARVRRGTSISYTGGNTPTRLSLDGSSREDTPSRASIDGSTPRTTAGGLADVPESESLTVPQDGAARSYTSPAMSTTQPSPALSATSTSATSTTTSTTAASAASTLLEQNADLLSIIAKKERKCLDLREELKRNEADLVKLKNKWQAIVARSLQQQAYQPYIPSQHRSSPSIATTASTASPNTSPTPRPAALLPHATHSLDLSLLTSTFEPADYNLDGISPAGAGEDVAPMEIPESVKAAGNWLGGALGRVLEAAVGMPPPSAEEEEEGGHRREGHLDATGGEGSTRQRDGPGLGILAEEEEEDDEGASVTTSRSAHGVSTSPEARSPSAILKPSPRPEILVNSTLSRDGSDSSSTLPAKANRPIRPQHPPLSTSSATSPASAAPLPSPSTSPTHSRTRSAFSGLLSDKLSSRWAALSSSEMVQSSKRATLGLVDTFEQGLAHALGPLEPPPLPPMEQQHPHRRGDDQKEHDAQSSYAASVPHTRRLPMPGATPGQGFASLFASSSSSTSPRLPETPTMPVTSP
ncbi:hypothetical protein JCM10908_003395 [Rhodotorula pacifica]|uniref:uncharacterized protein n=1 Tax=Rhodotorula pacifica TaxID=1495444 RepID=UPI00317A78D0